MAKTSKIRLIREKLRDVEATLDMELETINAAQDRVRGLEATRSDLETTLRVLLDLSGGVDDEEGDAEPTAAANTNRIIGNTGALLVVDPGEQSVTPVNAPPSTKKPDGIPPVTDMIFEALADARKTGKKLMEPADMQAYIDKKYWPGVPATAVGPIAWRLYKRHKLIKRGSRYGLPQQEAEGAQRLFQ